MELTIINIERREALLRAPDPVCKVASSKNIATKNMYIFAYNAELRELFPTHRTHANEKHFRAT